MPRLRSRGFTKEKIKMMLNWNGYRQQLIDTIGQIARLSPDTVRGYSTLSAAGSKTNHLDPKMQELIALAVAVTLRCDGCITVHTDAAMKQGASQEEIAEALGVAVSVNASRSGGPPPGEGPGCHELTRNLGRHEVTRKGHQRQFAPVRAMNTQ